MGSDTAVEREGKGKARTSGTARDGREDAWGHRDRGRNARANTKHLLTPLLMDCLLALPLFHSRPRERPSGDDSRSRCKECDVAAKARKEGTSTAGERACSRIAASRARNGQSRGIEGEVEEREIGKTEGPGGEATAESREARRCPAEAARPGREEAKRSRGRRPAAAPWPGERERGAVATLE